MVRRGRAWCGKAVMAWPGLDRLGLVRSGMARWGRAWQSRQRMVWLSKAARGKAV
jgi:hypothetical protein